VTVFTKRLKQARLRAGLSQERLGVLAGIDEHSASARMNQYERGKHAPDWLTVERLAAVLRVPVAYLYAADDEVAELLLAFYALGPEHRAKVLELVRGSLTASASASPP
jgi:transcriptional regulator with XRE-family HTH domain